MDIKLLIDGVVRQTTVLIAQLSTAAGVRAPLAHVADQVFLSLATEIERQGVGRKVVADMFGMALRAYQKKVQRLTESASVRDLTLWEAVLDFITAEGTVMRSRVLERFSRDGEKETIGVLTDLVGSGLVYASGRGSASVYGVTSEVARQRMTHAATVDTLTSLIWGLVYRSPGIDLDSVRSEIAAAPDAFDEAIERLVSEGRVDRDTAGTKVSLRARNYLIPVGTEKGWEGAVFDHYQAVTSAIGAKLGRGQLRSDAGDVIGGSTLRFQIASGHPHETEVLGTLRRVRAELDALWRKVSDFNDAHPIEDDERIDVCFYFGQSVRGGPFEVPNGSDDTIARPSGDTTDET